MSSAQPPLIPPPTPASAPGAAPKAKKKVTVKKAAGPSTGAKAKSKRPTVRTKRPAAPKRTAAANNETILANAAAAKLDLAKQRSLSAARRQDPLWYRIEDVLPAHEITPMSSGILPEQVQVVEKALSHVGLSQADVTPQAMACLLEQARRTAHELTASAQDCAYAAGRLEITNADLLLARELRPDRHSDSVTTQIPKLNLVAQHVNRAPLPPIPSQCYTGVVLPPKAHQLTARTFDVVSASVVTQNMVQTLPAAPAMAPRTHPPPGMPGYGAARGRQIPIQLTATTTTTTPPPAMAVVVPMDTTTTTTKTPTTSIPPHGSTITTTIAPPHLNEPQPLEQHPPLTFTETANPLAPPQEPPPQSNEN